MVQRHTWAVERVAPVPVVGVTFTVPAAIEGPGARAVSGARAVTASARARAPRSPLLPHTVHCAQRDKESKRR